MATVHIMANEGDFAPTVLMPGDPLRAKAISERYLTNARTVNTVRGMLAYTGEYEGKRLSVMASGMGCPSMGIYSHELFFSYGVERIIRIGTTGAIANDLHVGDLVIAMGVSTDNSYAKKFGMPGSIAPLASYELLFSAVEEAKRRGYPFRVGNVLSSDYFYNDKSVTLGWGKMGVLAVEMETNALYLNAMYAGKQALALFTVSDELYSGNEMDAEEREACFERMFTVAAGIAK